MIPIHLTLSGFLSYRDPAELDFTTFDLACIAGANGAGKSSILDAITWALFGQARKRDDSIINTQSELASVALIFSYEGDLYRIQRAKPRGKTATLEFQIALHNLGAGPGIRDQEVLSHAASGELTWKPLTEHSLRATQRRIEEALHLDYETFTNASFFLQGKADQFTQQRPGDRKRILASILGLETWETYRKRAVERRKAVEAEIASLDGRLAEITAELDEEQTRKAHLAELEEELEQLVQRRAAQEEVVENIQRVLASLEEQRKLVDALGRQLEPLQQRREELDQRIEARQAEKESLTQTLSQAEAIEAAYQAWLAVRDELARWEEIAGQFRQHEKRREEPRMAIETERARLIQEKKTLETRQIAIEQERSSRVELQSQITALQQAIAPLEEAVRDGKSLEAELVSAQEALATAQAENPRLKAEMEELKARIDQLEETEGATCPLCGQPLQPEERQALIKELSAQGKALGDRYRANKKLLAEARQRVAALKSQLTERSAQERDLLAQQQRLHQLVSRLEQITTQIEAWEEREAPRLQEIRTCLEQADFAPEARARLAEIDAELKAIGYDAAEHDRIRAAEREMRNAEEAFHALGRARAALDPLQRELAGLEAERSKLSEQLAQQEQAYQQVRSRLQAAEERLPDVQKARRELFDIQARENRLRMEVGAARQKVLVLDDLKARREALEADRQSLAQKAGRYQQLERAFGKDGVPALLIEQALPQIENQANRLLDRLSNGTMSVRFVTQREYKDKKRADLRETLDIQILDSAGRRDYEMFSGGEAFRVNFAIRLALSEVLAQRAGARLQTLIIDEGFGSQDEVGRQRLIEAINTIRRDFAKILVITHIESLKEAFPTRIEVVKTPRGSTINVV